MSRPVQTAANPANDRQRDQALHDAMWRGHGGWEMALTPALFGFLGWLLDDRVGTEPAFLVAGVLLGLIGSVANQYFQYKHHMAVATEARRRLLEERSASDVGGRP